MCASRLEAKACPQTKSLVGPDLLLVAAFGRGVSQQVKVTAVVFDCPSLRKGSNWVEDGVMAITNLGRDAQVTPPFPHVYPTPDALLISHKSHTVAADSATPDKLRLKWGVLSLNPN